MRVRLHPQEADRLSSLRSYEVLDTARDDAFDAVTRLAALVCRAPVALISLVDDDRQWFLGSHGNDDRQTLREQSVCSDVVAAQSPLTVPDLAGTARYAELDAVVGSPGYRAYAGTPLIGRDGLPLGALCVLDTEARAFAPEQLSALDDLAKQVIALLELRRRDAASGLTGPAVVPEARQPTLLRQALDGHEFVPFYQTVVDLQDGHTIGLEALVRWQHPTRGLLTPDAFLPGLETGMLALWTAQTVLEAACLFTLDLDRRGLHLPGGIAVNLSGQQLRAGLATRVLAQLARHGLPGAALTLEITESAQIPHTATAVHELQQLRSAGVRVAADDFGVGWSNLTRLLQLPFTSLKIDRELVTGMVDDPVREQMVSDTIALAATMGLDVVAEGVETDPVRQLLLDLGCTRGQGWLFSRPLPAADVAATLTGTPAQRAGHGRRIVPSQALARLTPGLEAPVPAGLPGGRAGRYPGL